MWIEMKKTYAGSLGLFAKGLRYDVPCEVRNALKNQDPDCLKNLDSPFEGQKVFASPSDKQFRPGKKGSSFRTK